jgi:hypothetical protein
MTATPRMIAAAARAAFEEARRRHGDEQFYVYALFSETGDDLQPTCHSEEALARRVKASGAPAADLRWFAEEFEYHQLGEEHFAPLGDRPARRGFAPAVAALRSLDRDGFFGRGRARDGVAVLILRDDQSNREIVELARKLNPRAVWPRIEAAFEVPEPTGNPRFLPGRDVYSIDALALSADRTTLAAAGWFGGAELFAWRLGKKPRGLPLATPRDGVGAIALSPDGKTLFAAGDRAIRRWSLPSGKALAPLRARAPTGLAVSRDGRWLIATTGSKLVRWSLDDDRETSGPELSDSPCFSPDGKRFAGLRDGRAIVLDARTLARAGRAMAGRSFAAVAISNARVAAVGAAERGEISVFPLDASTRAIALPGHARARITALAFSPSGKRLASAGDDAHVRVFDVATRRLLADVRGRQESMSAVVFLDENEIAAAGCDVSNGPPVYVWKLNANR